MRIEPDNLAALNDYGIALALAGRKDDAVTVWKRILTAHPGYPPARANLDRALGQPGNLK